MLKSLSIVAVLGILMAPAAQAARRGCCCNPAPAAPAAATAQAQSPQANRSFSYEPSVGGSRAVFRSTPSGAGFRSADSKILGNY
jgi:hypothetical protein